MADKTLRRSPLPPLLLLLSLGSPALAATVTNCAFNEGTSNAYLNCPRSAHTATLLPSGDILIAGGVGTGGVTDSYEIDLEQKGQFVLWGTSSKMVVARASHTATLLPNGKVLVTGGINGAGVLTKSAELYNPVAIPPATPWSVAGGVTDLVTLRYNHSATLLKNGKVLICGGQGDTLGIGNAITDCRFYDPATDLFSAAPALLTARGLHSATLLPDGRVFIAGGIGPLFSVQGSSFVANTEIYDPATNSFAGAHGLLQGRAYHTATMMGDGTVLFVGGYNGNPENQSYGVLQSAEIYDPISDSVAPASPFCNSGDPTACVRVQAASAVLAPDGQVVINDGLGNVSTGFFTPAVKFETGSTLQLKRCSPPSQIVELKGSTTAVRGNASAEACSAGVASALSLPLDFLLTSEGRTNIPVEGMIQNGTIYFSTPSAIFPGGFVYFGTTNPLTGLQADLSGTRVTCNVAGCGHILKSFSLSNIGGYAGFSPIIGAPLTDYTIVAGASGCIDFKTPNSIRDTTAPPAIIDTAAPNCTAGGGNRLSGPTTITGLPASMIGAVISSGTIILRNGIVSILTSTGAITFTINVTAGHFTLPANTLTIDPDPLNVTGAQVSLPNAVWTGLTGSVLTTSTNSVNTPLLAGAGAVIVTPGCGGATCTTPPLIFPVTALQGSLTFIPSKVDLSNVPVTIDIATVVIRNMVMHNSETYNPKTDKWAFNLPDLCFASDNVCVGYHERFGETATLLPTSDIRYIGGKNCNKPLSSLCTSMIPVGSAAFPDDFPESSIHTVYFPLPPGNPGPGLTGKRANHTATPLPDGRLLVAGGSNGPNSLQTAEIFDPVANTLTPTGSMAGPHTLHTANLLPNGKVLVAGGFTTNSNSSGSTTSAEIYYPNPGIWIPTSPMNAPRDQHTATLLPDGNILVAGGFNRIDGYLNSAEIYFSTVGAWRSLGNAMPRPLARHTATLLQDGEVLFVGGINNTGILGSVSAYNPTTTNGLCTAATWCDLSAADSLKNSEVAYLHSATLLPGGSVLVAGGANSQGETTQSQLFDPSKASGSRWSTTRRRLSAGRANHTAILLPNGTVMVMGGATHNSLSLRSVETFDVGAGSWTSHGFMAANRAYHTTTLLADGNLYTIGGINGATYLNSTERLYFGFDDSGSIGSPPSIRVSSISAIDMTSPITRQGNFNYGSTVTFSGTNFMGFTEANGGSAGSDQSGFSTPRLLLQSIDGSGGSSSQGNSGFIVDLTTRIFYNVTGAALAPPLDVAADQVNTWSKITANGLSLSSMTIKMPDSQPGCGAGPNFLPCEQTRLPTGWYHVRMANNALFSGGAFVQVGPPRISSSIAPLTFVTDSTTATFSWAPAAGADGYNIYSATAGVWVTSLSANTLFYALGSLSPNTTAAITVAPFSIMGDGPTLTSAQALTLSTNPASLAISSVGVNSMILSWSAHGNGPNTSYEVTYASVTFATFSVVSVNPNVNSNNPAGFEWYPLSPMPPYATNDVFKTFPFGHVISTPTDIQTATFTPPLTATSFTVSPLSQNTTYFFRVRAINSNQVASTFSNLVSSATRTSSPAISFSASTTSILWTWADLSLSISPVSYNVRTASGGFLAFGLGSPSFLDTGLLPNTTRQIQVSAVTTPGEGDPTLSGKVFTLAAAPLKAVDQLFYLQSLTILPAPTQTYVDTGTLAPHWRAGLNPNGTVYSVQFGSNSVNVSTAFVTDKGGLLFASFSGLVPAEIYTATVTAFNGDPTCPLPGCASLETFGTPPFSSKPREPSTVFALKTTPNSITLNWDTNGNASTATYAVYISSYYFPSANNLPQCSSNTFTKFYSTAVAYTDRNNFLDATNTGLGALIGSLLTNTTYSIAVCARNAFPGLPTAVPLSGLSDNAAFTSTITFGGGAAAGSFSQTIVNPNVDNDLSGTVDAVNPRAVTLHVPAGAFPSSVAVTFSSYTNTTPLCPGTTNLAISIVTVPPFQPVKPLTLSLQFTAAELAGLDISQVSLMRYDPATNKCIPFITSVDRTAGVINAQINHFTLVLAGVIIPSNTVETARAFPNPFFASTDGFVTFENIPPFSRIRIFTMQGETVYDRQANGSGLLTWPGINKNGRFVASGTYFVAIEAVGSNQPRKLLKLVVLR